MDKYIKLIIVIIIIIIITIIIIENGHEKWEIEKWELNLT